MIDVGTDHNPELLRIIHSNRSFAAYVALSHCWGDKITPLLTTGTLTKFQECLPFHELPTNFRDAITITRELGIWYLSIDSLYVLQDSMDNWKREFMRMGLVYRISLVTISALSSERSTDGILKPHQITSSPPLGTIKVYPGSKSCHVSVEGFTGFTHHDEDLSELAIQATHT